MDDIFKLENITQFNKLRGLETHHPLVNVFEFSNMKLIPQARAVYGFYCVFLKESVCGDLKYGCNYYDYQEGTMVFLSPGQVVGIGNKPGSPAPKGWGLLFHPDLIRGTSLAQNINKYSFFSYESSEALHISESERQIVMDCLNKINNELHHTVDKHSRALISDNIELLLNYCLRFYDRQFITREHVNNDILIRFEKLLEDYFKDELPLRHGLPTVKYCSEQLHLSTNYFGDLIKKQTGISAQKHIQMKMIIVAKERMYGTDKTVSEIAYELGFRHPQHFSRLFKKETGHSPNQFRFLN